jgi:hypothetical protein
MTTVKAGLYMWADCRCPRCGSSHRDLVETRARRRSDGPVK